MSDNESATTLPSEATEPSVTNLKSFSASEATDEPTALPGAEPENAPCDFLYRVVRVQLTGRYTPLRKRSLGEVSDGQGSSTDESVAGLVGEDDEAAAQGKLSLPLRQPGQRRSGRADAQQSARRCRW